MDNWLEMVVSYLLLLFAFNNIHLGESQNDGCNESRCGGHAIRFPFRLNSQPDHCGYPGFNLSCTTDTKHTVLQLPISVKLFVKKIDYKSQVIQLYDPDHCLLRQLGGLDLSSSPFLLKEEEDFQFEVDEPNSLKFALFNCSPREIMPDEPISCLSGPVYQIYLNDVITMGLLSCTKMCTLPSIPYEILVSQENILELKWSTPACRDCEVTGKVCRLKNNSTGSETECISKHNKGASSKLVTTGIILGSFLLALGVFALYRVYSYDKVEKEYQAKIEKFLEDYRNFKPTRYSYIDIKRITNQFTEKLGQGAYGTVFKGKLSTEIHVAVKILNISTGNGEDFINEVGIIGRIHHVNVVRLVGFCADGFRRALVYEFLQNDSLEKYISSADSKNHFLGWDKLQYIALSIAKGIEYLHQGCDQRILHFDIKPHNILLDQNFNPKISDFGLAKLCSKDQSIVSMTTAKGTMGYIAPEVFSRNFGNVSYKADVYSFGMVLLEILRGNKKVDDTIENTSQVYFPEWIYALLEQRDHLRVVIEEDGDTKIAKKLALVGLWCIQWHPVDRPSMKEVVQMLEGEEDKLTMPPNPFASTGHSGINVSTPARRQNEGLEAIPESE